jgi:hypothetical protein
MGDWRYYSTFLYLGSKWSWVVSFTPLPLYSRGSSLQYQLDRSLGGLWSRPRHCGTEKNLATPRNWTLAVQPRIPSLYWLSGSWLSLQHYNPEITGLYYIYNFLLIPENYLRYLSKAIDFRKSSLLLKWIWSSHSGAYERCGLLACNAV